MNGRPVTDTGHGPPTPCDRATRGEWGEAPLCARRNVAPSAHSHRRFAAAVPAWFAGERSVDAWTELSMVSKMPGVGARSRGPRQQQDEAAAATEALAAGSWGDAIAATAAKAMEGERAERVAAAAGARSVDDDEWARAPEALPMPSPVGVEAAAARTALPGPPRWEVGAAEDAAAAAAGAPRLVPLAMPVRRAVHESDVLTNTGLRPSEVGETFAVSLGGVVPPVVASASHAPGAHPLPWPLRADPGRGATHLPDAVGDAEWTMVLASPAAAGSSRLEVVSIDRRVQVGHMLLVSPGTPDEEVVAVGGFGPSILTAAPLRHAHAAGTVVRRPRWTSLAPSPSPEPASTHRYESGETR